MRRLDALYLEAPFFGSRRMVEALRRDGVRVGRHRVRRRMRLMGGSVSKVQQRSDWLSGHGMRVMFNVTDPDERKHTMTEKRGKAGGIDVKAVLAGDDEFIRTVVRAALQEVLEAEMTEAVGAGKGERTANRLGYRSGYGACLRAGHGQTRGAGR